LQREVVDLAFEVEKLAGQRAALPDASAPQLRERLRQTRHRPSA
jgi:hypothetical protein